MDVAGVHTDSQPDTEGSSGVMGGSEESPPCLYICTLYSGAVGAATATQQRDTHSVEFIPCTELTLQSSHTLHKAEGLHLHLQFLCLSVHRGNCV